MRVIAGRFGGRRLQAPKGRATTRPTSDRVKEAIFAMLGTVEGEAVLDLFAGTGALGIEALSRGARAGGVRGARRGRAGGVEGESGGARARARARPRCAAERRSARCAVHEQRAETYDLVLIDPPYRRAGDMGGELSPALESLLAPQARVVVESDRRAPLELPWEIVKERRYGDTAITIHRHDR